MDQFEEQLKQALQRTEPNPGFEERVSARLNAGRGAPRYYQSPWLRIAAAALVMIAGGSAWRYHQGQVAKEQVLVALRLAGGKLSLVQTQVRGVQ